MSPEDIKVFKQVREEFKKRMAMAGSSFATMCYIHPEMREHDMLDMFFDDFHKYLQFDTEKYENEEEEV